jgi:YD repeat-containing protein
VTLDYTTGRVLSDTDALGRKTTFTPDSFHRITDVTFPEGNKDHYDYDSRGNVLLKTSIPKPGSGLANVVVQAVYPVNCTNPKTCNQPASVIDARGNQTDLTYDSAHGGILTKTLPPDVNGIRPQTRYQYSQLYAWKANASGIYSQASAPVWRLTSETYCRTTAATGGSCAGGAADEVVTTYEYQVGNSAKGSNVLLIGIAVTADGKTLRTCYGYDKWARRISETQPNANLASCQ